MIRLAVVGASEKLWLAITARLRGATFETGDSLACDAVVFFDFRLDEIDRFLRAGIPVLIATADWLSKASLESLPMVHLMGRQPLPVLVIRNPDRYLPSRQLIRQHHFGSDQPGDRQWQHFGKIGNPGLIRIHRWQSTIPESALLCDLDLILWYFRQMPNLVHAIAHARGIQIHLGFPGGGMALVDHAIVTMPEPYYALALIGASGAAYADDQQNMQLLYQGGPVRGVRVDEGIGHWVVMLQEFIDAVAAGRADWLERPHFAQAVIIAEAIDKSLQTRQAVVPEGFE